MLYNTYAQYVAGLVGSTNETAALFLERLKLRASKLCRINFSRQQHTQAFLFINLTTTKGAGILLLSNIGYIANVVPGDRELEGKRIIQGIFIFYYSLNLCHIKAKT